MKILIPVLKNTKPFKITSLNRQEWPDVLCFVAIGLMPNVLVASIN